MPELFDVAGVAHEGSWCLPGWKLNPVVGAVYGPEFYAGKYGTRARALWAGPEECPVGIPTRVGVALEGRVLAEAGP